MRSAHAAKTRPWRLGCFVLMGLSGLLSLLPAKEVTLSDFSRVLRRWGVDEGLVGGRVESVSQAPNGILWIGTERGVFRFNGQTFVHYATEEMEGIGDRRIANVIADREGTIWIMSRNGRIGRLDGEQFIRVPIPLESFYGIQWNLHPDGGVLAYATGNEESGLLHLSIDGVELLSDSIPGEVHTAHATSDGRIWIARLQQTTLEWKDGEIVEHGIRDIGRFLRRSDGSLLALGGAAIYEWQEDRWHELVRYPRTMRVPPRFAMEDDDGRIWFGNRSPDHLVWDGGDEVSRFVPGRGSFPGVVQNATIDQDGDLWFATFSGLFQARYSPFITWGTPAPMPTNRVIGLRARPDGSVWFYGFGGACQLAPNAATPSFEFARPPLELFSSDVDEAGNVWLSSGDKVFRNAVESGGWVSIGGAPRSRAESLVVDAEGVAWLANRSIYRCDPRIQPLQFRLVSGKDGLPRSPRSNLRRLPDDSLLAVVLGSGLFQKAAGSTEWLPLTPPDDELAARLWRVDASAAGGFWGITLERDLCCWVDGVRSSVSLAELGMEKVEVVAIALDAIGGLWFATRNHGVVAARCEEVRAFMDGSERSPKIEAFDQMDGLGSMGGSFKPTCITRAPDGRVWVANDGGVSVIQPEQWALEKERATAPPVQIDDVTADGSPLLVDRNPQVPPGASRLDIDFAAVTFAFPDEVQYRYRLKGFDEDWIDAETGGKALYRRLDPGDYSFEVMAASRFGVWNEEPTTLAVTVLPSWWQRVEVRVLIALAMVGLAWLLYSLRLAALRREQRAQIVFSRQLIDSQEEERKRIAGELHDGLGQQLLLIKNSSQLAEREFEGSGKPVGRLSSITDLATDAIGEVRGITRDLRPIGLERLGLVVAIESMVDSVQANTTLKIQCHVGALDHRWPLETQLHIFRIFQEGLNNALKHAEAGQVALLAIKQENRFELVVQDDGKGFEPKQPAGDISSGMGLGSIRERARILGGSVRIESKPGQGTRIVAELPDSILKSND